MNGRIQVCCSSEEYPNSIRRDDGLPFKITDHASDEEIMNSKFMKDLRLQMLKEEWPSFCKRCQLTEATGGVSRRLSENERFEKELSSLIKKTETDGTIPVEVKSVDMRLGNICNLACRMCNPRSSSAWIKDWLKVDQHHFVVSEEEFTSFSHFDWFKSEKLFENFKSQVSSIKYLHFAGGEPLFVPEMLRFLEICVDSGHSKSIELSYNTNITVIPEKLKTLWPKFKGVKLLCSIDAYGERNDFIRYPSKWDTIHQNLKDLDVHFKEYGLKEVLIAATVQVYNILKLEELVTYLFENFKHITPIPHFVDLHVPNYYNTQILPLDLKLKAKSQLEAIFKKYGALIQSGKLPATYTPFLMTIKGSINHMMAVNKQEFIPLFLRASLSKSKLRNEDLFSKIPELRELESYASTSQEDQKRTSL